MTKNEHRVAKAIWTEWTEDGRRLFNQLYEKMSGQQDLYRHPKTADLPEKQWHTTAWNAAWEAASIVSGTPDLAGGA